jgi:hypothetical protein
MGHLGNSIQKTFSISPTKLSGPESNGNTGNSGSQKHFRLIGDLGDDEDVLTDVSYLLVYLSETLVYKFEGIAKLFEKSKLQGIVK